MTVLYKQMCSDRNPRCELHGITYTEKQYERMDSYRKRVCSLCGKQCEFDVQVTGGIPGRKGPGILRKPKKRKKRKKRGGR